MSPCRRCDGVLVRDWDVESRSMFLRCVQCSNRPLQVTYRADGLPIGAPLLCVACHQRPRATIQNHRRGDDEISRCVVCRENYNRQKYPAKTRKGNVTA